jgi:hypothetical protein
MAGGTAKATKMRFKGAGWPQAMLLAMTSQSAKAFFREKEGIDGVGWLSAFLKRFMD